jgi:hypothetical protein
MGIVNAGDFVVSRSNVTIRKTEIVVMFWRKDIQDTSPRMYSCLCDRVQSVAIRVMFRNLDLKADLRVLSEVRVCCACMLAENRLDGWSREMVDGYRKNPIEQKISGRADASR